MDPAEYQRLRESLLNRKRPNRQQQDNDVDEVAPGLTAIEYNRLRKRLGGATQSTGASSMSEANVGQQKDPQQQQNVNAAPKKGWQYTEEDERRLQISSITLESLRHPSRSRGESSGHMRHSDMSHCTTATQDTDLESLMVSSYVGGDSSTFRPDDTSSMDDDSALETDSVSSADINLRHESEHGGTITERTNSSTWVVVKERDANPGGVSGASEDDLSLLNAELQKAYLFDPEPLELPLKLPAAAAPAVATVSCVSFSRAGERLAVANTAGVVWITRVSNLATSHPGASATEASPSSASPSPAVRDRVLDGHQGRAVTGLEWNDTDQFLITIGFDAFVIVWDAARGTKIRQLSVASVPLAARFVPGNNNYFIIGLQAPALHIFNLSTGMLVRRVKATFPMGAVELDRTGTIVITGDSNGTLVVWAAAWDQRGSLKKVDQLVLSEGSAITSILCHEYSSDSGNRKGFFDPNASGPSQANSHSLPKPGSHVRRFVVVANIRGAVVAFRLAYDPEGVSRGLGGTKPLAQFGPLITYPLESQRFGIRSTLCSDSVNSTTFVTGAEDGQVRVLRLSPQGQRDAMREVATITVENNSHHQPSSGGASRSGGNCCAIDVSFDANCRFLAVAVGSRCLLWHRLNVQPQDGDGAFDVDVIKAIPGAASVLSDCTNSNSLRGSSEMNPSSHMS